MWNVKNLCAIITVQIYHQTFFMRSNFEQLSIRFFTTSSQPIKKEQESYLVLDFDTEWEISLLFRKGITILI